MLDVADEQPEGAIFLIPVRLKECDTPEKLRRLQWVDYRTEGGYERLLRALEARARYLGIQVSTSGERLSEMEASEPPRPYAFERLGGELTAACLHADGRHAWAGGESGRILKSDDGGQTWERVAVDRSLPTVLSIRFPDDCEHGWTLALDGVSPVIYATENGGRAWEPVARFGGMVVGDFLMHAGGLFRRWRHSGYAQRVAGVALGGCGIFLRPGAGTGLARWLCGRRSWNVSGRFSRT